MLQLTYIRQQTDDVRRRLAVKHFDPAIIDDIIKLDDARKAAQTENDGVKSELNTLSKEIGALMAQGKRDDAEKAKEKTVQLKDAIKELDEKQSSFELQIRELLYKVPNLPHSTVPPGRGADDNEVVREGGVKPTLYTGAKPHWDLTTQYDIVDFEVGVKVTGAGFPFYKGKGAKLQRALISFFLDNAIEAGYVEVQPPLLVNEATCYGTAQLPDKDGQMYYTPADDFYLIPTAEVPVTNMYRDVIIPKDDFSIKHCAYSQCFRREAGSYGKDVRGLNRLHQFDKVEIVRIEHPEKSYALLEEMLLYVESLLQKLELPYRILRLCGGDMTFASALTYDFEVWSAAQQRWLEVSSVSNFESYQSNRMMLRFKDATGKTQLCHTLNGSAMALPRIVASLLENNQTADGIHIPKALQPYTGFTVLN